jgi:hypothetical protein
MQCNKSNLSFTRSSHSNQLLYSIAILKQLIIALLTLLQNIICSYSDAYIAHAIQPFIAQSHASYHHHHDEIVAHVIFRSIRLIIRLQILGLLKFLAINNMVCILILLSCSSLIASPLLDKALRAHLFDYYLGYTLGFPSMSSRESFPCGALTF